MTHKSKFSEFLPQEQHNDFFRRTGVILIPVDERHADERRALTYSHNNGLAHPRVIPVDTFEYYGYLLIDDQPVDPTWWFPHAGHMLRKAVIDQKLNANSKSI